MITTITFVGTLFLGSFAVLQSAYNRLLYDRIGGTYAIVINGTVFLALGLLLWILAKNWSVVQATPFAIKEKPEAFPWWILIPGIFGFCLVTGIPMAIAHIGALRATLLMILAQLITGMVWDSTIEKTPLTTMRLLGAILSLLGVVLASWKPNET